jgi:transcription antitermination protein NusB
MFAVCSLFVRPSLYGLCGLVSIRYFVTIEVVLFMSRRSRAREVVLQLLFQKDQNPKPFTRPALKTFVSDRLLADAPSVAFCLQLFDGVITAQGDIDKTLTATADNWRLHRMLPVDRNLLRIAVYEMAHADERTPAAVAINESIELARRYGSADSPAFVNGILDKIAKELTKELSKDSASESGTEPTPSAAS